MKKIIVFVGSLFLVVGLLFALNSAHGAILSGVVCTMEYNPVCATIPVQCIMAPCNPIKKTFSNACVARASGGTSFSTGACESSNPPVVGGNKDKYGCITSAGYTWDATERKCFRPWEKKKSSHQILQDGTWTLESYNGKQISQSGTITFTKNSFNAKICNNLTGRYGVIKNMFTLRKIMSTRMYCEGDGMKVEYFLTQASRISFTVKDTKLTMKSQDGNTLTWKK